MKVAGSRSPETAERRKRCALAALLVRRLKVPSFLHELHGEAPTVAEMLATYLAALASAAVVLFLGALAAPGVRLWRLAVAALVAADLAGGVVASSTASTSAYYAGKPARRRLFIGAHVVHPAVLAVLFPASALPLALAGLYSVAGAYAVDALPSADSRRLSAAVVVALGAILFAVIGMPLPLLSWFAPVFLVKLVWAFAARRSG